MPDPRPESDPEFADPSLLFGRDESPRPASPTPRPAPGDAGGYEVEGPEPEAESSPAPPVPPVPRAARPRPIPSDRLEPPPKRKPKRPPTSGVDQVWTRGAEWGADLLRVGIALLAAGFLLYQSFSVNGLGAWVVLLAFSIVGLVILAYPIFITLERPVRVTPEQALKDYFGALSHRVPHYRRMWLLLSTDGRTSPSFSTFPEFGAYWKARLATWKAESRCGGFLNPLTVEVSEFKSDKSAGQTEIEAEYTARVMAPGRSEPVATYRISLRLVRGDDKMWYLESGTLD